MDRQINGIRREEAKVIKSIKDAAKKGDKDSARILAKEVVQARKAVNRFIHGQGQFVVRRDADEGSSVAIEGGRITATVGRRHEGHATADQVARVAEDHAGNVQRNDEGRNPRGNARRHT